jgi:hypothetical protein
MERTNWTDERLDDNFHLLRADISRLDLKLDATAEGIRGEISTLRGEISALKNALIVCAFGVVAAIVGSSAL